MQAQITENRKYLESKLGKLIDRKIIDSFTTEEDSKKLLFNVSIIAAGLSIELIGDMHESIELVINNYFRDVSDYTVGSYKESIDWYLGAISKIAQDDYSLIDFKRGGQVICRYIKLKMSGGTLLIGDSKSHFKLFAKRTEIPHGNLGAKTKS